MRWIAMMTCLTSWLGCSEPADPTCQAGRTQDCWCVGGGTGTQVCGDDGARWEACECAGPDGDADGDSDGEADAASGGFEVQLHGAVDKGPFVVGSLVTVALVDAEGNPSGEVFITHTIDDLGRFDLELRVPRYASLEATGFYYNEVTGQLSGSQISLRAFYEAVAGGRQDAFINIFTHLSYERVRTLLLAGADFDTAIRQAERALRRDLGVGPHDFDPGVAGIEMNILGGDTDANAYLLAVSAVLAQAAALRAGEHGSIDSALQEVVNTLMRDLRDDGELSGERRAELRAAEEALDPVAVMDLLVARLAELGSDAAVPDIRRIIDRDDDGFVNADDCDDTDPEIHPGAVERCNGLDDDCDGAVPEDGDGDGFADAACGGNDCDDHDASAYPGAPDTCGDGLDTDCLGDVDLPSLGTVVGDTVIAGDDDVAPLRGYSSIAGSLMVTSSVTSLIGIECLGAVEGDLAVQLAESLASLRGLDGLTAVAGLLRIEDATALTSLDGLGGIGLVGGAFEVLGNTSLTSLDGIEGLTDVGDNVLIRSNRNLGRIDALRGLTSIHTLTLDNNDVLLDVDGLEGLSTVAALDISNNDTLDNLDGLIGLTSVEGLLLLGSNDLLSSVDGLSSLTRIDGALVIVDNDTLTDLDGLAALEDAGLGITIWNNDRLPTCEAEALVERLRSLGWDGVESINSNAPCP
jgi:hypothetical protein